MSLETSLLFESYVKWVLLVFILLAIWFKFLPLIIVSVFLLILTFIIQVWKGKSLTKVKPTMELSKSRVFAEEGFRIQANIHNDKWLPLVWLEWVFPEHEGISLGEKKEATSTFRFLWILWYQRVNWSISGKALKRGVYNIGDIILRSGDGFRFTEVETKQQLSGKLYVYPKRLPVHVPPFQASMLFGAGGKKGGFLEDPLVISGVRQYQQGDEVSRFNWKATARTGQLQTNIYQPVITHQVIIYIDVAGYVVNKSAYTDSAELQKYTDKKQAEFEDFLSVISSVALKYRERGTHIGYATNAIDDQGKQINIILPNANITPVLDQFAEMTMQIAVPATTHLNEMLNISQISGPLFIFCNQITEKHYLWYRHNRNRLTDIIFYYIEETEYARKLAQNAKRVDNFLASTSSTIKGASKWKN